MTLPDRQANCSKLFALWIKLWEGWALRQLDDGPGLQPSGVRVAGSWGYAPGSYGSRLRRFPAGTRGSRSERRQAGAWRAQGDSYAEEGCPFYRSRCREITSRCISLVPS